MWIGFSCSKSQDTTDSASEETGSSAPVAVTGTNLTDIVSSCKAVFSDAGYVSCSLYIKKDDKYKSLSDESFGSSSNVSWEATGCSSVASGDSKSSFVCKIDTLGSEFSIKTAFEVDGVSRDIKVTNTSTPLILAVSPSVVEEGDTVTFTGLDFTADVVAKVTLGGAECKTLTIVSATKLTCIVPALTKTGALDVAIQGVLGDFVTAEKLGAVFAGSSDGTYPLISAVALSSDAKTITISGENFPSTPSVIIGSQSCTVTSSGSSSIICTVTTAATATQQVSVVGSDGKGAAWIP